MKALILRFWSYPDILRQTPGHSGEWDGIKFVLDAESGGHYDYVVIHGYAPKKMSCECPDGNVWLVMGEAPHEWAKRWHKCPRFADRLYMTDHTLVNDKCRLGTAFLPWWVDKDYDLLKSSEPPSKQRDLSWITSNNSAHAGHRYRLQFLAKIRKMEELDLFGRGFTPIGDKWDGLAPYRYSIAFENFSNSHYWSEKVMDCFLAWTMPIYFGCTDLGQFFPAESFVQLDPNVKDPERFLRSVISSKRRENNLDAIQEARRRVLDDYNLFNLIALEIRRQEQKKPSASADKHKRVIKNHTSGPIRAFLSPLRPVVRASKRAVQAFRASSYIGT